MCSRSAAVGAAQSSSTAADGAAIGPPHGERPVYQSSGPLHRPSAMRFAWRSGPSRTLVSPSGMPGESAARMRSSAGSHGRRSRVRRALCEKSPSEAVPSHTSMPSSRFMKTRICVAPFAGSSAYARTASRSTVAFRKYSESAPVSKKRGPNARSSTGGNASMCTLPATVPPRKPSFDAVASSWMLPFCSAAPFRAGRSSPSRIVMAIVRPPRYPAAMAKLDHPVFDCDNHYYEALDAFTRHLDPRLGGRCVQWAEIGGRKYHVIGGRVSHAVTNPTFNPIAKPGAMHEYFRGNPNGEVADRVPARARADPGRVPRPRRAHRRARPQGLEAIWLFPTLGVLYEELLKHDTEAVALTFRAFNQWLDEDWGCTTGSASSRRPTSRCAAPRWRSASSSGRSRAARASSCMRPAPAWTAGGPRSPGDAAFDPFWARVNEAGVTVVVHAGDSGYSANGYARDGFGASFDGGGWKPSIKSFNIERAAHDFLITLVFDKLFDRFPNLRIASVENGSDYLADLFKKLRQTQKKTPGYFKEDPVETFRRHVWINPFWEDDVNEIAAMMGPERVIFGSDWPHIEGMPQPLDYVAELAKFDPAAKRRILRENTAELNAPRPL